jgi:hypothetical protein
MRRRKRRRRRREGEEGGVVDSDGFEMDSIHDVCSSIRGKLKKGCPFRNTNFPAILSVGLSCNQNA